MKITDLHIDGFGVWSGLSLTDLADGVTVFYGRNEAGKTTLMQFVRSMLYGLALQRRDRYLPPVHGGSAGGTLYVATSNGNQEIQRHLRSNDSAVDRGDVALTTEDGTVQGQELLDQLLEGVDESIFNNVFALGLRDIQELGTLNDTDAAQQLYHLASGVDRVSLVEVLNELNASRNYILAADGESSEVARLYERHEKLETEIDELVSLGRHWSNLAGQCEELTQRADKAKRAIKQLEADARIVEIALQVKDQWLERRELDEQLESANISIKLDGGAEERLEQINARINRGREKLDQVKRRQKHLRDEANRLPINRELLSHSSRIEALAEQSQWIASQERQVEQLQNEIAAAKSELKSLCQNLGTSLDGKQPLPPKISRHSLSTLREPAVLLRRSVEQLQQYNQLRDSNRKKAIELAKKMDAGLTNRSDRNLNAALEAAGIRVSQLRRRLQLEERLDKLGRAREQLELEVDDLLERPVIPAGLLVALGAPFGLGVVLILFGYFWSFAGAIGWPLTLFGLAGWGVVVAIKYMLEQNTTEQLENCNAQLDRVRQQIIQATHDRDELDTQLGAGGGPLDVRLKAAERELTQLESLLPVDAERRTIQQHHDLAKRRAAKASLLLKSARQRWHAALRAIGLPPDLMPNGVGDVVNSFQRFHDLHHRLATLQKEFQQRRQELLARYNRIEQLSGEVGIEPVSEDARVHLQTLLDAANGQRELVKQRKVLVGRYRQLRVKRKRFAKKLNQIARRRRRIFSAAGAVDEEDFRLLVKRHESITEMRAGRDQLAQQITAAIGDQHSEEDIEFVFEEIGPAGLERRWDEMIAELERHETELAQLHQGRGELVQEMKTMSEDRRLAEAKLELGIVKQQLTGAICRWQVLAVVSLLLESIREVYETERQPETLREASKYLTQLTGGRYTRVWTPLEGNTLNVDDADDNPLRVELLSRGTREAVYLSLRLALASDYAKCGIELPLVLDDVLTNFDSERAKCAAKTLRDFSKSGNQVMLFTCHEHIVKAFKAIKADVRNLPDHAEIAAMATTSDEIDEPSEPVSYDEKSSLDDEETSTAVDEKRESRSQAWPPFIRRSGKSKDAA